MSDEHPSRIGSYRILEVLGEGGMGTVYLAEQTEPVRREVALKLIKRGMDSRAVLARFEQERQALALMNHEGIAKVFDCGTADRGQPYFVMERVEGQPIDEFCERAQLSLSDRIALVQQVCAAVQHAHQKGVVHRDLKPGNVLVSADGERRNVKVIDFGLAKAMQDKLSQVTLLTEEGQILGTPEYMAPEQADFANQDIDTRADIYSIGAMLYELLVGELPFAIRELREEGILEMLRILREVDPPKPSTRLSSAGDASSSIAAARQVSVGALQKALKTDLDWVVLKALEKDRNRRYQSASALGADLQRYLDHEPLEAGPPSAAYRLRKIARRYRVQLLAGGLVVAASLGFGVVAFAQYLRAEDNARTARANEELANDRAEELGQTVREFDQLAGVPKHATARAAADRLFPAWPDKVEALEHWIRVDCGELLAMREEVEETVRSLRDRALDWDEGQQQADREAHPRYAEWRALGRRLASLRRAQAIRTGALELTLPELTADQRALHVSRLNWLAAERVAPGDDRRTVWGEEALGLAAARHACAQGAGMERRYELLDTLAWAYLANGKDAEARVASMQALASAPVEKQKDYARYLQQIESAVATAAQDLAELESAYRTLTDEVGARRTWAFAENADAERFLHDTLTTLVRQIDELRASREPAVERRLRWARSIGPLTRAHPAAQMSWEDVRVHLATSPRYAGADIAIRDEQVWGLVPLGANPVTGLLEFYHLRSAWDGAGDPAGIPIPTHDPESGHIDVGEHTGIVFVLLPGGDNLVLGSQRESPQAPRYDDLADVNEAEFLTSLEPFFLARHELTQGQWARLADGDTERAPSEFGPGDALPVTLAHPVERVDWPTCRELLRQHGLDIPTEAQWEYGCRGGSMTAWWPGGRVDDLRGAVNLLDARAHRFTSWGGTFVPWDDGHVIHAPVGQRLANAFGLHDVHGNVSEWCRDLYGKTLSVLRPGDGLQQQPGGGGFRSYRGGGFADEAKAARSAAREFSAPAFRVNGLGVRAARELRRTP